MATYTFRYLNAIGAQVDTEIYEGAADADAVRAAIAAKRTGYRTLEVWRGEMIYRGSGIGTTMSSAFKYENYRNKAEELRIVAEDYKIEGTRRLLLNLANDYDRMAEEIARRNSLESSAI
ncbi:MAG: hypothetical protein JO056_01430 [Alphaproteobacteria bacterium]|nr:hypothetical protein [Alphaproteobacteria bacterium]